LVEESKAWTPEPSYGVTVEWWRISGMLETIKVAPPLERKLKRA
jgi:predicted secreted hydrolase